MRQAFFRLGEVVLEVVGGSEPDRRGGPARFFGIAITVDGPRRRGRPRSASGSGSPSRPCSPDAAIATFRKEAGLGLPVALDEPGAGRVAH